MVNFRLAQHQAKANSWQSLHQWLLKPWTAANVSGTMKRKGTDLGHGTGG
jgi:hypothetical protein